MTDVALEKIRHLAQDSCSRENCTLYDLEFIAGSKGKGRTLRVYIDRKEGGVSLEDCANVSRALSLLLDVEDVIEGGEYSLEVSSPGLDRILREKWHFESVIGSQIDVKTHAAIDQFNEPNPALKNRMKISGVLTKVDEDSLWIESQNLNVRIPLNQVARARKIFEAEPKGKKKLEAKKR